MGKHLNVIFFLLATLATTVVSAQTVYTTKTGEKYHTKTCRYLKYSRVEIDIKKAQEYGYDACSVCRPSVLTSSQSDNLQPKNTTATPAGSKTTSAVQCSGKTKAGNRCKRKTKSSNGRCYQH